ncbi:hypothetical protein SAMN02745118_01984 [Selenihalanaerobacter shriftii]|uniref:Uncharacterized protein n=2 Tax=Selenihalanaerobacter shriftii TaxID=142842 RepID=A0A1T4NYA8_9FIRM|nr:hypothetical protein [Selenihalanaerobacter shriftii]SJZ84201.1 hypothetical protein SAMN02745118_01984 [Selenihalanaerobacter shriftii]
MKSNFKFHPLMFQASLAAGGIALMAFNYLQFAVPHGKGLINLSDISWNGLTGVQSTLYSPLVAIMLLFTITHFVLTFIFLKGLVSWVTSKKEVASFISDPYKNVGIFAIIASLSMSANVFWAPVGFFVPQISANLQDFMLPSLIFFGLLWISLLKLEFKVIKIWLSESVDISKFNFIWLLDVFAFGLVNLTGTGIAAMSGNGQIAGIAAFASLFTLSIGFFLSIVKLVYLIYLQIKKDRLPDKSILPAYFLVIPIICLYGLSFYRLASYLQSYFSIDIKGISFFIINVSYVMAIGWGIFILYLLSDYFKNHFGKSNFAPPQWGMV